MIQESYPTWMITSGERARRLAARPCWEQFRDWWRGYAAVDLASYDAKCGALQRGVAIDFTDVEERAAALRGAKWQRG